MSFHKIRSALVEAFESGGFAMPVAYENDTDFEPKADTPYFRFYFFANIPTAVTLGTNGEDEVASIAQFEMNYPLNQGTGDSWTKADDMRQVFKAGSKFIHDGQEVLIRRSGVTREPKEVNGFSQSIFTIQYSARIPR
jgi:Bacteriophage related domain of unknown function